MTAAAPIAGFAVKELHVIPDDRGRLFEVLRRDDPLFRGFGQAYVTTTLPGVVKAWHRHQRQTDFFCCVAGMIKLVLVDDRPGSPSHGRVEALWLGVHKPRLVVVPPGVWHGWTCTSVEEAMVLNLATEPYDHHAPDEERLAPHGTLPYDWARRDG
jgi:dTDP-4-dehydrorhamnose 3,5-epimerase